MDPTVLELKYNDMLKHAKDLGINFAEKPKKDKIIEQIKMHYEKNEEENKKTKSSARRRARNIQQTVNYNEAREEPKKKKVKKTTKKSNTESVEEIAPANDKIIEPEKIIKKKIVKKKKSKKVKEPLETTENLIENKEQQKTPATPVTKKSTKIKVTLKNNETEEMKRVRQRITEKKEQKAGNKKTTSGAEDEIIEEVVTKKLTRNISKKKLNDEEKESEVSKPKVKKTKKIKFSEGDAAADISGDTSSKMKRHILRKKKKSSSPILKPMSVANHRTNENDSDVNNVHNISLLSKTNEIIEKDEINDDQFQLKLDDDSNEYVEKAEVVLQKTQPRKSVAFTIDNDVTNITPRRSIFTNNPTTQNNLCRSIAFTVDTKTPEPIISQSSTTPKTNKDRRSIAFTIDNTPQRKSSVVSSTFTTTPNSRRSIAINTEPELPINYNQEDNSNITNDDDTLDRTYEKPESETKNPPIQITSPIVSCSSFYKNGDLNIIEDSDDAPVVVAKSASRARIVRPKQVETTVEKIYKSKKYNQFDEVEIKKVVEIVRRETGPRIVKPTAPSSPKVSDVLKKKTVLNSSQLSKPKAVKIPDFKAIHNKNFNKSEDILETQNRAKDRHSLMRAGKVPTLTISKPTEEKAENSQTYVSSAIGYASSMLKKITPFGQKPNDTTENLLKSADIKAKTFIPKMKIGQVENKAPRTPLAARKINKTKTPSVVDSLYPITPQSNRKEPRTPLAARTLNTSNNKTPQQNLCKPTLTKPFHFQNQNLEAANMNFGAACHFGTNSGTTPLKDSAFNRRKSYNPRESIGRAMSYNPHVGKLKPLDLTKKIAKENMNESIISVKTASTIVAVEKRKSIFGLQKKVEKDKLLVKRKVMRNNEMDKPRILQN
jgi:hypothetical protein